MKYAGLALASLLLFATAPASKAAAQSTPAVTLSDGAVATGYDHCGEADLCARIKYRNGDSLLFYSEGAALDQPYVVLVVRTHQNQPFFEYARRLENRGSVLTLDRGRAQMSAYLNKDGTLRFSFAPVNASH